MHVEFSKEYLEIINEKITIGIKSKAIKGEANKEIIKKIAKHFKISTALIQIKSGHKSSEKIIEILQQRIQFLFKQGFKIEMNMSEENNQYYFNFSFFKVDPKWRWMADLAKEESAKEVENVLNNSGIMYRTYSNLGLRDDADFLFWFAAKTVEEIQVVIEKLYKTVFGKYIIPSMTYLSCTRPSLYIKDQKPLGFFTGNDPKKHVIVYPFTKTREWYLLPKEKRQEIMDEHIEVSKKYPQVVLNTTYSFGIHDEDFMLAFEVDNIRDFQDLIMDLRETQVSTYVKNDIPMIVCVKKDLVPLISSLGQNLKSENIFDENIPKTL